MFNLFNTDLADLDKSLYAAIDLGSNSFHLIVIRKTEQQTQVIDSHKEMIRLRAGLDKDGFLTEKAFNSGIECLEKFGQLLKNIPASQVRSVGTNTLRNAKNSREFLEKAQQVLGHDIDIISGEEEARMIFLGVSHGLPNNDKQHLIIDIGGGSTEFIIGQNFKHKHLTSTEMGCVSISQRFFKDNAVTNQAITKATNYCRRILKPHSFSLTYKGWDDAIGASGSIKAIGSILKANEFTDGKITLDGMLKIKEHLIKAGSVESAIEQGLKGLKEERLPVFIGGLVVLMAAFQELKITDMLVSENALREGLIYDTLGRLDQQDVREASVSALQNWLKVDEQQSERINITAQKLLNEYKKTENLRDKHLSYSKLLSWASKLHEGGISLSYKRYRQHSAYIIQHAELAGFSQQEQLILAKIVQSHQGKFNQSAFEDFNTIQQRKLTLLTFILRIAVLLHRGRKKKEIEVQLVADKNKVTLYFDQEWLDSHPLTSEDLEAEAKQFKKLGFELVFTANKVETVVTK